MPKYWWNIYLAHGRFPEVGQKQKTERKKKLKVGNNNATALYKGGIFRILLSGPNINLLFITEVSLVRQSNQLNNLPSHF